MSTLRRLLPPASRFLSQAECTTLAQRVADMAIGSGNTGLYLESRWTGNVRYARNAITTSGDVRDNETIVVRDIRGASAWVRVNQTDDGPLEAAVRRCERFLAQESETGDERFQVRYIEPKNAGRPSDLSPAEVQRFIRESANAAAAAGATTQTLEVALEPTLFFDATYAVDGVRRAESVRAVIGPAAGAGMLASGYLEVAARGRAVMDTWGQARYYPSTHAKYSVTVRDAAGTGSGWAGVDWNDWGRLDLAALANVALQKCLASRNPIAIEPGRFTVVLEPQAVCDLCAPLVATMDRATAEWGAGPFGTMQGRSRIGERVIDARLSLRADPMDPDLGFVPFDEWGNVYHAVTWIQNGVLAELPYYRPYAVRKLGINHGLPNSGAFRLSGTGTSSIETMIANTKRGLLVTRFSNVELVELGSWLCSGYTRNGLWLIENGKISKPIKNFRFVESPMFVLNNVDEIGVSQRVFHPGAPVVVPPLRVRDFNFLALSDAV